MCVVTYVNICKCFLLNMFVNIYVRTDVNYNCMCS